MRKYFYFASTIIFVCLLSYKSLGFLDPDLGWHLVGGKNILLSGFLSNDPFSYTMPSFFYINHEWLSDVIFSRIFDFFGVWGLSIFLSILAVISIWIQLKSKGSIINLLFLFVFSSIFPFFGLAPRVFSWFLFSALIYITFDEKRWSKFWFTAPLIILIWVNIHGSFPLGIVILATVAISRFLFIKKLLLKEFFAVIFSFLVTLINPFGTKIWSFIWLTISDTSMKSRIVEWQPLYKLLSPASMPLILLLVISILLIYKYKAVIAPEKIITTVILFVGSLLSVRQIPFLVITLIPILLDLLGIFEKEIAKTKYASKRLAKVSQYSHYFVLFFVGYQFLSTFYYNYYISGTNIFYPDKAIEYLNFNAPMGQMFNEYDWGGHLTWKYPQKKVFVNGAMTVWKRKAWPEGESADAASEYFDLINGKVDYKKVFYKYGIDTVLLMNDRIRLDPVRAYFRKTFPFTKIFDLKTNTPNFKTLLISENWKIVYEDEVSVILKSP